VSWLGFVFNFRHKHFFLAKAFWILLGYLTWDYLCTCTGMLGANVSMASFRTWENALQMESAVKRSEKKRLQSTTYKYLEIPSKSAAFHCLYTFWLCASPVSFFSTKPLKHTWQWSLLLNGCCTDTLQIHAGSLHSRISNILLFRVDWVRGLHVDSKI